MADFTKPALTSTYTNFITELKGRDNDIASLFSNGSTFTGTYPIRAIRWNESNGYFERRNSANNAFERLEGASGTHKFVNLETGALTATGATINGNAASTGQVQGARFNVTGTTAPANGFYLPAANEVRFTTNSTDRLTIESSGEVGIGTVDPAYTLDITGTFRLQNGTNDSYLEVGNGGSGNRNAHIDLVGDATYTDYGLRVIRKNGGANTESEILHRGTGDFNIIAQEAADTKFWTNNTIRMIIDSGGSVCIGNDTSPDDRLHIKQATNSAVYIRVQNNDGYARFGTDANDSFIDADVHNLRNRAGSSTYLISSSSLFDIKTAAKVNGALEVTGTITGNIATATTLATARTIGGVSFDGSANINLPGVNTAGNQDTTGTATNSTQLNGKASSASGNRWGVVPFVDTSGVLEVGKSIDFHTSDGSTADNAGRINSDGTDFSFSLNVVPNGSKDLGSSSNRWQNLYVNDLKMSNKGGANDVDGTWGDYTIQEGENDLFIKNERNGKVYKINWTEVVN
tara:strand:+ start:266 stop:1816 length:1551 start_codon:yes stop_codon:yes gene_type:complete